MVNHNEQVLSAMRARMAARVLPTINFTHDLLMVNGVVQMSDPIVVPDDWTKTWKKSRQHKIAHAHLEDGTCVKDKSGMCPRFGMT